jgi:hypothetical protein
MKRYLFLFAAGAAAALLLRESNQFWLFPAVLIVLAVTDRTIFRIFRRWKLWFFLALLVAVPVLLVGEKDGSWMGLAYNSGMLRLNLLMVERSIILMLTIKMFTNRLEPESISRALAWLRLHQFDQVFRLAQKMLPGLRTHVSAALQDVEWRKVARRPASFTSLLGQLVARLIHAARSQQQTSSPSEDVR